MGDKYQIFRDDRGIVTAINRDDGASLPWDIESQSFDKNDPLTIELQDWESENGALDLSQKLEINPHQIRAAKIAEISAVVADKHDFLTLGHSSGEKASWDNKIAEANAIVSGRTTEGKFLEIEARQIATSEQELPIVLMKLAKGVLQKREILLTYSAILVGLRTKLTVFCHKASSEELFEFSAVDRLTEEFERECAKLGLPIPF